MSTNAEYFERWENSGPKLIEEVMPLEEAQKLRSTSQNETPPWETYQTGQNDPALDAAIAEYAQRVSDAKASSQTQEELCRQQEAADTQSREYRWLDEGEYKKESERIGRVMHHVTFLNTLREAGVKCWYRTHPQEGKITLVVQRGDLKPEVGCWVQIGYAPELSVMRFDEHGIPTTEKYRGWRTATLQLILKGLLTEEQSDKYFGLAPTTRAFARYNRTLQQFRNQGGRLSK